MRITVCVAFAFFTLVGIHTADAASLSFSPSTGSSGVGRTFTVNVYVSSQDKNVNAIGGVVSFPADKIEVVSVSKTASIMTLWVQEPTFSNSQGTVNFEGIALNPGFIGSSGKILAITLRGKAAGNAPLAFTSGSVLANDGQGTNILESLGNAVFAIGSSAPELTTPAEAKGAPTAPVITSSTHPDSTKWYNNPNPIFSWKISPDITAVQILVGKFPSSIPLVIYAPPITRKEVSDVSDGEWYVHIRSKNGAGWGAIAHMKFQIDTKPPEPFTIVFPDGNQTDNPQLKAIFTASDILSGIDYYKVKIGDSDFLTLSSEQGKGPFMLPLQGPGKRVILVQAYDRAGNMTSASNEFTVRPIAPPVITEYPRELPSGDPLIVKGTSLPDTDVILWLQRDGENAVSQSGHADISGNWVIFYGQKLESGVYGLRAETIDHRGAKSEMTQTYYTSIGRTAFFRISDFVIRLLGIIIPVLALLFALGFLLWHTMRKVKKLKGRIRKESREAQGALHKAFDMLKENVRTHVKSLEKAKTKRELTTEEENILVHLKQDLEKAERIIKKEIDDIEKGLK